MPPCVPQIEPEREKIFDRLVISQVIDEESVRMFPPFTSEVCLVDNCVVNRTQIVDVAGLNTEMPLRKLVRELL